NVTSDQNIKTNNKFTATRIEFILNDSPENIQIEDI
ncbi:hypothetical protein MNBD_BACTEROID04-1839, partial [hydrothermal vent metagenome]